MTAEPENELPHGWKVRRIYEVAAVNPKVNKKEIPDDLLVSFVPMPAVGAEDGSIDVNEQRPFAEVKKGYTGFAEGDVLFAKITPCMENGKMAVVPPVANGYGFGSTEFHVLRPNDEIDSKYLYYYVSTKQFRGEAERHMTGAVGQRRVPAPYLKDCLIPVAPPKQQQRIVAEIEKQFSRLDEAVANLKRVKANLKRYKATVLKAAVEGKLTEEWRKAHPDVEPASKLLDRILAERRAKWEEAELAKMEAKGKAPKNDKWKAKYKEPATPDASDLPELAAGWVWTNFDQVTERVTKGSSPNWQGFEYSEKGIPFVRSQNVGWGVTDLSDVAFLPQEFNEKEKKSILREGDVLLNIVGASIGRAAIAPSTVEGGNVNQAVAVIRLLGPDVSNEFVLLYLLSTQTQRRIHAEKVDVARANFSLEDIREMPLALPPRGEQDRIATEVERHLSLVREIESQVDRNRKRAERLRQSILTAAFAGRLRGLDADEKPEPEHCFDMVAEPAVGYESAP